MNKNKLAFGKMNYIIMGAGLLLLILGFYVMTQDGEPYGFGSAGLTIGPLMVIGGFITQFFAIMYRTKEEKEASKSTETPDSDDQI